MSDTLDAPERLACVTAQHPLSLRLVRHAVRALPAPRRRDAFDAYVAMPPAYFDDMERELAHVLVASGQSLDACLRDLDAFNALTPEVENDAWYDQPRAFTSMHLDALLLGFSRRRLRVTRDQLRCAVREPARVLEVGSGSGRLAGLLADAAPDWRFTLVDRSAAAMRFASWLHAARGSGDRVRCLKGDLAALPAPDGSVDVVVAAEVLEHAPEPARSVQEMLRVLRPGGWLAVSVPVALDIAMHPTVFHGTDEVLAFFEQFPLEPLESVLVKPEPRLDAIAEVFPGFPGCVNAVFRHTG
jgi:ubiquinone/menaquinone biosynthesis C-methylase UbiE